MQALLMAVIVSEVLLILHTYGHSAYLYWSYWWFDILVHSLGGLSLGLLAAVFIKRKHVALMYAGIALCIFGWEVFEVVVIGINPAGMHYAVDTVVDVLVGFAAASVAVWLYRSGAASA